MLRGTLYSNHKQAGDRAAWKVVQKRMPDLNEEQCRKIIETWIENGVLYSEEYFDTKIRKKRQGLRVNNAKRPGEAR
jgi:hypothetical protein